VRSYGLTCVLARQPSPPPSPSPLSLHDALPISEKAEQELAQLKTQSFIASALREHGLSEDLSEFVSGGSEEEIKAKVAKLAEKLGTTPVVPGKPKPKLVPGDGSGAAAPDFDPEAIAAKIRKRL